LERFIRAQVFLASAASPLPSRSDPTGLPGAKDL